MIDLSTLEPWLVAFFAVATAALALAVVGIAWAIADRRKDHRTVVAFPASRPATATRRAA